LQIPRIPLLPQVYSTARDRRDIPSAYARERYFNLAYPVGQKFGAEVCGEEIHFVESDEEGFVEGEAVVGSSDNLGGEGESWDARACGGELEAEDEDDEVGF